MRGFAQCEVGPDRCRRRPIRAHVISRTHLSHIIKGGHGIRIEGRPATPQKGEPWDSYQRRILQLTPVGMDNLLVFRGICGHHDTELFKNLDNGFERGEREHAVMQAFRTALYQDYIYWREAERMNRLRTQGGQKRIEDGGRGASFSDLELRVIIPAGCARIHRAQLGSWVNEGLYEKVAYRQMCFEHPRPAAAGAGVFRAGAEGFQHMDSLNLTVIPIGPTKTIVNAAMARRSEGLLEALMKGFMQGNRTEQKKYLSDVMLKSFPDLAIAPHQWEERDSRWREMLWKTRVAALTGERMEHSNRGINLFE